MRQLSVKHTTGILPWHLMRYVFFAWLLGLGLLLLVQVLLGTNGLMVYPSGEDLTWMRFVQPNKAFSLHHQWWTLASRNPLAPWWYWYISPFILKFPQGLYLARKCVDLFLGMATLLLVYELLHRRHAWLAVWTAIIVLFWNFSAYLEQILFVMLIALGFSLTSIYAYLIYLHSDRTRHGYLVASLMMFFIALATYSIQCGVPLAILVLCLADALQRRAGPERTKAFKDTLFDLLGYLAIFIIFTQIWTTTAGGTSSFFQLHFNLFIHNFFYSIKYFAWHDNTAMLIASVKTHWPKWAFFAVAMVSMITFTLLTFYRQMRVEHVKTVKLKEVWTLLSPLIVIIAVALPTLILESTSDIWAPGARSEMLQQIFNPFFYVFTAIFFLQGLSLFCNAQQIKSVTSMFLVLLCTATVMISLEYNRKLVEQTQFERHFIAGLKAYVPEISQPTTIVAKVKNYDWYDGHNPAITNLFIQYSYNSSSIHLETIGDTSSAMPSNPVVFASQEQGVYIPGIKRWVPYDNVLVVEIDKNKPGMQALNYLNPSTLTADAVTFLGGAQPHMDTAHFIPKPTCPARFQFDFAPNGTGWSIPELTQAGEPYIWMADKKATLLLRTNCAGAVNLSFKTLAPMSADILDSLRVSVAGQVLLLKKITDADGSSIFSGQLPANAIKPNGRIELKLTVNRTMIAEGGDRTLAIPFRWVELKPER